MTETDHKHHGNRERVRERVRVRSRDLNIIASFEFLARGALPLAKSATSTKEG
ncbi:MAG: hypothetical protein K9N52_00005 [Verrucomicrobia bacterium]|nr:hypothetical protein [Verrucomicrobiota bacterium]